MRRLSWVYPADWRRLYGAELDELLEQTPSPGKRCWTCCAARWTPASTHNGREEVLP